MPIEIDSKIMVAFALCRASYDLQLMPSGAKPFYHSSGEVAGLFCKTGDILYRAWKGTHTPFDWLHNAQCIPDASGVHGGVAKHYESALASMVQVLETYPLGSRMTILDTGHSLGGALAEVAWANGALGLPPITFEAMRVFTSERVRTMGTLGVRIVNERDIVPHFPGRLGLWSYQHRSPALRFCGDTFEVHEAHSLVESVGRALAGKWVLEGPLKLD